MDILFRIEGKKETRVITAIAELYPIPMIEETQLPAFTEKQWVKECIRNWLIKQVARYEERIELDNVILIEEDAL